MASAARKIVFHRGDEGLGGRVEQRDATAPQQMRETRLVCRVRKLALRLPAIALQHAGIVDADDVRGLCQAAAGLSGIDGRFWGHPRPEPLQIGGDAPARFIRRDHGTAAHRRTKGVIGRLRLPGRAMPRVHNPPRVTRRPNRSRNSAVTLP